MTSKSTARHRRYNRAIDLDPSYTSAIIIAGLPPITSKSISAIEDYNHAIDLDPTKQCLL